MSDRDVERALLDLGRHVRYPRTPDIADAVVGELRGVVPIRAPRRARPRRVVLLAAATLLLLVGGLAAFVPGVRAALVRIFTFGAVRIEVGAPPPSPARPAGGELDLGRPVTLSDAQDEVTFRIRLPQGLGPPDGVYDDPVGELVWLAWESSDGLPAADETGLGLLVAELRGRPEGESILKKVPFEGTRVEVVRVGEESGFWLEGRAHHLVFIDDEGRPIFDSSRLAGNTLIWVEGDVTYRLESALARDEAIALAEAFR